MYELVVEDYFAAAHRLKFYKGRCENLHGHNWKVQVFLESKELNKIGMAIDFKDIKGWLKEILETIDHTDLNELDSLNGQNPTSENLARWIYEQLLSFIAVEGIFLKKVTVWESRDAAASYFKK